MRSRAIFLLLFLSLFFVACSEESGSTIQDDPDTQWAETEYSLVPANSCDDVKEQIIQASIEEVLQSRYSPYRGWLTDDANAVPEESGGESPTDYTTTNVQEEGVDELDIVKTDGDYIYTINEDRFLIVDSWPITEVSLLSAVELNEEDHYSWGHGLFLKGDKVVVFSSSYYSQDEYYFSGVRATFIDVTDRSAPVVERVVDLEGYLSDARMIDGEVYAVVNAYLQRPDGYWDAMWSDIDDLPEFDWEATEEEQEAMREQARPIVESMVRDLYANVDITEMMPRKRELNTDFSLLGDSPLFGCNSVYLPATNAQLGALTLAHLSLNDIQTFDTNALLATGWQVYASMDNLYVAMSSRWWWWGWGVNSAESHIHKFGLNGPNNRPQYVASGKVDGWILNQFSMSEYQGYLRVASTDNQWNWDEDTQTSEVSGGNHITVLEQDAGLLNVVGELRDLATGEEIFAARMMGAKGYIVTFEQTDPLFTLDLSDPTNPTLLGELHINGFSSYLHPVGENHLLAIGKDATSEGSVQGVHLQIFDVSDMTNPTRTFHEVLSTGSWSSWSEAMWNHHAFTYHPVKEILAFPINIYEWDQNNGENFTGLLVYKASAETGFEPIGRVSHGDLVNQSWCQARYGDWTCDPDEDYQWWTSMRRSVFIEDYVYSLSDIGLKVNDLLDPTVEHAGIVLQD